MANTHRFRSFSPARVRWGWAGYRVLVALAILGSVANSLAQEGPVLNDRFPLKSGDELSPPIVSPVGECAKAVHVSGYLPHALIKVFANHTEQIGTANPYFADTDVPLTRELRLNDVVTATQTVHGFTSAQTPDPVIVGGYSTPLNQPVVGPDLYACGQIVPVNNLNPGTHVTVFQPAATQVGQGDATQAWQPIETSSLNDTQPVTAIQTACPDVPAKKIVSLPSDPVNVHPDPTPIPPPSVGSFPVGADAVVLDDLLVGSAVQVFDNGTPAGGGLATASRNRAPLSPAATSSAHVTATQTLCSPSAPSPPQTPSTSLGEPIIATPVCEGSHQITVLNTYVNSIVVLFRNGVIAGMAGGDVGNVLMDLGDSTSFNFGDELQVVQYVNVIISARSPVVFVGCGNVITQHNDNARSGLYPVESQLTPANVKPGTFGLLYSRPIPSGDIVAQPLYVRNVKMAGVSHNLFFIATSTNNVYAYDAENIAGSAGPLWTRNLCGSVKSTVCQETYSGFVGVTSTPVIDPVTNTMYVVARCSDGTGGPRDGRYVLYALDIATGNDHVAPVVISATFANVVFDFHCHRNRPGLLLLNGTIYIGFATFSCDAGCATSPYHGWVMGYRATDLTQVSVFCTSPSNAGGRGGAGIWQTGKGLVGSPDGSIFFETGNGPDSEPLQNNFVKLGPGTGLLSATGHFHPNNAGVAVVPGTRSLADGDTDLGSGGPMLLPGGRLIGGGKQGRYYVLDTGSMKLTQDATPDALGFNGFQAFTNTYHADSSHAACPAAGGAAGCDTTGGAMHDPQCYINPVHYGDGELCGPNIHSGPVFWQPNPSYGLIYEMPEKDFLKAFKYDLASGHVAETPFLVATGTLAKPPTDGMPGGYSSVSANGSKNGIVWTSLPDGDGQWNQVPGRLAAFNATTLAQIWSDDDVVNFTKSVPPTIADGKVIRALGGFPGSVRVYGLLKPGMREVTPELSAQSQQPSAPCYTIEQKYANYGSVSVLGKASSDVRPVGDKAGGKYQDFRGSVFGMTSTVTSVMEPPGNPIPTCSVPVGRTTVVVSSIYWSPATCAHVVQGEIRDLWLKLGGARSKLGYPTGDETTTPDHRGRMSTFQNGQIWWYPEKGAFVNTGQPTRRK